MPDFENDYQDRFQAAVYWPVTGYDSFGQFAVGSPQEIRVRWVYGKKDVLDPEGNTITVDATAVVDRTIAVGSDMWLGKLTDWYAMGSAGQPDDVLQVKSFDFTTDMKNRFVRRTVGLMRKHDKT